jgi:hypothetical protein
VQYPRRLHVDCRISEMNFIFIKESQVFLKYEGPWFGGVHNNNNDRAYMYIEINSLLVCQDIEILKIYTLMNECHLDLHGVRAVIKNIINIQKSINNSQFRISI